MANDDLWTAQARRALERYDEKLLRQVANRLFRINNKWAVEELIEQTLAKLTNPPVLDRKLKDLSPACRLVLALIGHSRQPRWAVGSLVEMLVSLGQADGLEPIITLIETGLLFQYFPDDPGSSKHRIKDLSHALANASAPVVFTLPEISARARAMGEGIGVAQCPGAVVFDNARSGVLEADGLDWPLRLAVLWQSALAGPLRWTQQGDFFKRDLDRLRQDPILSAQPHDALAEIPDPGLFVVSLALAVGVMKAKDDGGPSTPAEDTNDSLELSGGLASRPNSDLVAGSFPEAWSEGLPATLAQFWSRLPFVLGWNTDAGWQPVATLGNPYPAAHLLVLLLLGQLGAKEWATPSALEDWILAHHPFWNASSKPSLPVHAIERFLLGIAYPLRLLQATKGEKDEWLVRLSPMGRWLLGLSNEPAGMPSFPQTLLVQPTLEILAYRQGLTPALIFQLSRFAGWKGLGAACTLQIEPESVYRALESGETFASLMQTLERHGMKATPPTVIEALRTWSNKRDRITVYPSGVLLEFPGPDELAAALARGLPAVRLSDRLAIVQSESDIDYKHFRLTGTRDYLALPERCVDVDDDGVTLSVDLTRSDLLLETELVRFAEPIPRTPSTPVGIKHFRLTPASVTAAHANGLVLQALETWFQQRTGATAPAAARMLLLGPDMSHAQLRRQLVLHVETAEVADGLQQWPATRSLFESRLGPTCLSVLEENLAVLHERMKELGMQLRDEKEEG